MRARPGRILSLSTAIALCVALIVPSGIAFGADAPVAIPPQHSAVRRTVATPSPVKRRAVPDSTVAPATPAAPSMRPARVRSVVDTRISFAAASAVPVSNPLAPSVPGELIVVLDSSSVATSTELALEARGATVERPEGEPSSLLLKTPLNVSEPVFTQLAADTPGVAWVQPNYVYSKTHVPNDPRYPAQWGLPKVGAPAAWNVARGKGVLVAIVDTGVDYNHPDLVGRVNVADGRDFVNDDDDAWDDNGHGTHVSGIVAATMDNEVGIAGLAPECVILPVKVLGAAGSGGSYDVARGIMYAADHAARIINLSVAEDGPWPEAFMQSAVEYAQSKGCIVIAAAGNGDSSGGASYPARYTDVVGVAAVDSQNARAAFSNYGEGIDVAAPGIGILSTVPGNAYGYLSGTSMASPFVAGIAALILGTDPSLESAAVIARIKGSATFLGSTLGAGLVNARKALEDVPPPPGSDVPGLLLGSSPVTGSIEVASHRVYRVYLGKDQTLETSLTSDPGPTDFDLDLKLYGPNTSSITTGTWVDFSVGSIHNPETIVYQAPATGWYYLDVKTVTGQGTYSLVWAVTDTFDDEIPGVPIPASPVTGTVDHVTDLDDVYAVELAADELLVVELAGPLSGADMDTYLFAPGAKSVADDGYVAYSAVVGTSAEWFRYRAPKAGTYYVDVRARTGGGSYALTWSKTPGIATDNIPGLEPTSSSVEGTIGGLTNTDDVYKVFLQAGQSLGVTVTTGAGPSNYPQVYVYPPTAVDVASPADIDAIVAEDASGEGTKTIEYKATSTGWYYIDLYSLGDPIGYLFQWRTSIGPDDNIPGVAAPKSPIRVAGFGVTTDTDNVYAIHAHAGQWISASLAGAPVTSTDFDLYLYGHEATDTRTATPLAKADASRYPKSIGIRAPATGTYYMRAHAFAGEGSYTLTWSVKSFATVYKPVAPSRVTHGHHFTVYGYVAPRHTSGTYLVTLRFYRKSSAGVYVYHHSVKARRYSYSSSKSKYRTYTSLPHTGVWRVRAVHSDSTHATSYSAYDYITVR